MAILSGLFFWLALKNKYTLNDNTWLEFIILFIFVPVNWTFFTIPMPDSTGLLFFSAAAYIWTLKPTHKLNSVFGSLLFLIGFVIRPYYVLLIFFFYPGLIVAGITLGASVFLFWFWYRYWNQSVTTFHGYFGIQFQTMNEVLKSLPNAIAHLPVRIFEHTAVVGLVSFYIAWKKYRPAVGLYILSVLMMYVLKSTHVAAHGYYLLNAGLFAVFTMFLVLKDLTDKQRAWFLAIFLLYTFSNTQHNFHANKNYKKAQIALLNYGNLDAHAVVATYMGLDPQWLYYIKRTGFIFNPSDFNNTCPVGATHFFKWTNSHDSDVELKNCIQ